MHLRPATAGDLPGIDEIDATIDSAEYLHVERVVDRFNLSLKVEPRPLRERLIQGNRLTDDVRFTFRQIAQGEDDGWCFVAEHDGVVVAAAVATIDVAANVLRLVDIRVDFDQRREGLATAMMFQLTQAARDRSCRAVAADVPANCMPTHRLLDKCGFELSGLDTRRYSNHDLAREITTLFWHAEL